VPYDAPLHDVSKETHIRVSYQMTFSDKAMPVPQEAGGRGVREYAAECKRKGGVRRGAAQEESDRSPTRAEIAEAQSERMDCASAISDEQLRYAR
jgi:hypothetical protein